MQFQRLTRALVLTALALLVIFTVLMSFQVLLDKLGDSAAARVSMWTAVAFLLVFMIDLVLLVLLLGVRAVMQDGSTPTDGDADEEVL